jgi:2-polyprenyl-3-methyl-5-hydroxy-6-metoxy-1,4-benzoquinol methylase
MGDSDSGYQFGTGIGEEELARLEAQGAAIAPATRMIFAEAGIRPGMRVLDLGCGAGDVAFVAADLVGPGGFVVGVDRSPDALARARLRAGQHGLTQVQFVEGDIHDPVPGGPFDAIVERLVLWAVPDPAALLRQQATALRPGGLVVPVEADLSPMRWLPETPLGTQVRSWLVEGFAKAGLTMLGPQLWAILQQAGLRPRGMIGVQPHFGPGDPAGIAFLVENMRVAAPLITGTGVATAEEIGMETFEQRLRDEGERTQAVNATYMLLSAWATTGPELTLELRRVPRRLRPGCRGGPAAGPGFRTCAG